MSSALLKPGRIVVNHQSGKMWSENNLEWPCSLKRLKSNHRKSTVELTAMFNSEGKSILHTLCNENLKRLAMNSCVASRKPLVSEANREKKALVC